MHLPMHTHRCGIHIGASEDRQMCQHYGVLLDKCGADNCDGFVDLHLTFPLGSQAANSSKTKSRLSCYARTRSIVSRIRSARHRSH